MVAALVSVFKERDAGTEMDVQVKVLSVVQVSYGGSNEKAEPGIRPWNGAASLWQSSDTQNRNATINHGLTTIIIP